MSGDKRLPGFSGQRTRLLLGDHATIRTGGRNNQDKSKNGEYPFFVRSQTVERINSYCHEGEAIIVPGEGKIGSIIHYVNGRFDVHQRVYMVTELSDQLDARFVYYYFSQFFGSHAMRNSVKATVDSLRLPAFKQFELQVPVDVSEQRAIARILSDTDDLIDTLDAYIAKKRDIKTAVMQELLTAQTRLPGYTKPWEPCRLGDLATLESGGTPDTSQPRYYNGGIPWVSISDITRAGKYLHQSERTLTEEGLRVCRAGVHGPNVILFAMYASLGECSIATIPVSTSQAILSITPDLSKSDLDYLYYQLLREKPALSAMGQTGTQKNLNAGMVRDIMIPLPPLDEQRSIARVLSDMDAEIEALEQRRDKTKGIKKALMHDLLTGRRRLSDEYIRELNSRPADASPVEPEEVLV